MCAASSRSWCAWVDVCNSLPAAELPAAVRAARPTGAACLLTTGEAGRKTAGRKRFANASRSDSNG
jgi:hypothetical protein